MIHQLNPTIDVSTPLGDATRVIKDKICICGICGNKFTYKKQTTGKFCGPKCVIEYNRNIANKRHLDSIGLTYNGIKILDVFIKITETKKQIQRTAYCKALCHCGKIFEPKLHSIKSGITKSCRCFQLQRLRDKNPRELPEGESCFNLLYASYRGSAKKRNYEFDIEKDLFRSLVKKPCFYCNRIEVHNVIKNKRSGSHGTLNGNYSYNGLDRIDNSKGYVKDNIVTCCGDCNKAKSSLTQQEFFKLIILIYKNLGNNDATT